jgi:hypothetical protein
VAFDRGLNTSVEFASADKRHTPPKVNRPLIERVKVTTGIEVPQTV